MKTYNFAIIVSGLDVANDDAALDRLFAAGCGDATVSVQKGLVILEFDRAGRNFVSALVSAMRDIQNAGGKIERVEPDHLVSASDIAKRAGVGRAAVSLYASGSRGEGFPHPVARVTSENPLWDWVEVSSWLHRRKQVDLGVAVQARLVRETNRSLSHEQPGSLMFILRHRLSL